ncbi:MAG: VCBS repeat-containing protein [Myxococcota bacterium]|nr:VCBS repeat-containing protein [Myxococcota bacterium]
MRTNFFLYGLALAVSLTGCGDTTAQTPVPDTSGPADTGPADLGNADGNDDVVEPNPYGPCEVTMEVPSGVTRGVVELNITVTHPDGLPINTNSDNAGGFVLSPSPELLANFEIGNDCAWYDGQSSGALNPSERLVIPADAADSGTFTLTCDSSDIPLALSCANVIVEMALPEGSPEEWAPPTCSTRKIVAVDNAPPECDLAYEDLEPQDYQGFGTAGVYVATMPYRAQFKENALLDSISIKTIVDGESVTLATTDTLEEVFEEIDGEQFRRMDMQTGQMYWRTPEELILDVCSFGTDLISFTVEGVDKAGNVGVCSLTPRVVRCPDMIVAQEVQAPPDVVITAIAPYDVDADGNADIVAATSEGIIVYSGHENGIGLRDEKSPITVAIEGGIDAVVVDDLNGSGGAPDYITVQYGDNESRVQIWGEGTVCTPPTPTEQCEFLKSYIYDFDPEVEGDELLLWDYLTSLEVEGEPIFTGDCDTDAANLCSLSAEIQAASTQFGLPIDLNALEVPGTCTTDYGLVEEHVIPTLVTTHLYREVVKPSADAAVARDLMLGGADGAYALNMLVRQEPLSNCTLGEQYATVCGVNVVEGTEGECFKYDSEDEINHVFSGPPDVNSLAVDDIVSKDGAKLIDVVASHDAPGTLTVFQQVDALNVPRFGAKWIAETDPSKGPITKVVAAEFGDAQGGGGANPYTDLMILMPEAGEIWQMIGQGDGNFEITPTEVGGTAPYRVASCVEGKPVDLAATFLGDPTQPFFDTLRDLVVINDVTNTLWTFRGKELLTSSKYNSRGGILFDEPRIIDTVDKPVALHLADINGDNRLDAVTLGADSLIAVNLAGNTELLPSDPKFSEEQTFIGAVNITTPIPEQGSSFNVCDKEGDTKLNGPTTGTPLARLTPAFMDTGDLDGDDFPDVLLMTERTPVNTSDLLYEGINFIPFFVYQTDSAPYVPLLSGSDSCLPVTQACFDEESCSASFGPDSGPIKAMVTGRFTFSNEYGVAWASATEFDPALELATIGMTNWNSFPNDAKCYEAPSAATPIEEDEPWQDIGHQGPNNTQLLTTIECNGDPYDDLIVAGLVTELDTTYTEIWVRQTTDQAGPTFTTRKEIELLPGVGLPLSIKTTKFGGISGIEGDAEDFMLVFPKGLEFYEKVGGACQFRTSGEGGPIAYSASASSPIVDAVMQDLDGDGLAELIVASAGRIDVAQGQDVGSGEVELSWATPALQIPVEESPPKAITIADLNGDGELDILTLMPSEKAVWVYPGLGTPYEFGSTPQPIRVGPNSTQFAVEDVNRDGCMDLLALSPTNKAVSLLKNRGGAQGACFEAPTVTYPGGKSAPK